MSKPATALARVPENQSPAPQGMTPADMIAHAVSNGANVEVLERLMGLQERWHANQARRAYDAAIAAAKAKIKPIVKKRLVDYEMKAGGRTIYKHESLDDIADVVDPILAEHDLYYRYRAKQDGTLLTVFCVVSHKDGHSEETPLSANNDASGGKNAIQAVGSAATYLQRYTLKLALGLSTTRDDDARAATPEPGTISEAQIEELKRLADDAGVDPEKFCEWLDVPNFGEIPLAKFEKAKRGIAAKKNQASRTKEAGNADH